MPSFLYFLARVTELLGATRGAAWLYTRCWQSIERRDGLTQLRGKCALRIGHSAARQATTEASSWFLRALDNGAGDEAALEVLAASASKWSIDSKLGLKRLNRIIHLAPELAWPKIQWCRAVFNLPSRDHEMLEVALGYLSSTADVAEYALAAKVLRGRCHLERQEFEAAERCFDGLDLAAPHDTSGDTSEGVRLYQLALLGQHRFAECLEFAKALPTRLLSTQSRQVLACCHHALGQLEEAIGCFEEVEPRDLSKSSRCIYLNALTRLKQFDRLSHVLNSWHELGIKGNVFFALQALVAEWRRDLRGATALYAQLAASQSETRLGFSAKNLDCELRLARVPPDFNTRVDVFIEGVSKSKGAIEEPILEALLGNEQFLAFRINLILRLVIHLWRRDRVGKAIELVSVTIRRYPAIGGHVSELLFLGGLRASLRGRTDTARRLWDAIPEGHPAQQHVANFRQFSSVSTGRPSVPATRRDSLIALATSVWFRHSSVASELLEKLQRESAVKGFEALLALDSGCYETAVEALGAMLISSVGEQRQQLLVYLGHAAARSGKPAVRGRAVELLNGAPVTESTTGVFAALYWMNGRHDLVLNLPDSRPEVSCFKCLAGIELRTDGGSLIEHADRAFGAACGNASEVALGIVTRVISYSVRSSEVPCLKSLRHLLQRSLQIAQDLEHHRRLCYAVAGADARTIHVLLRYLEPVLMSDFDVLRSLASSSIKRAIEYDRSVNYQRSLEAWRVSFAFLAPILSDGGTVREWAERKRGSIYGKAILPAHADSVRSNLETALRHYFETLIWRTKDRMPVRIRQQYAHLIDEFTREKFFIARARESEITIPGCHLPSSVGPYFIQIAGRVSEFLEEASQKEQRRETGRDEFLRMIAERLGLPVPRHVAKNGAITDWRELSGQLGVARVLLETKHYQRALSYLAEVEFVTNAIADAEESASIPFNVEDSLAALQAGATRLEMETHGAMAKTELARNKRDFEIVGRHWTVMLDLASRLGERAQVRDEIVKACLGIAKVYASENRFTVGVEFLEQCHEVFEDARVLAEIAQMRTVLAVAHAEKSMFDVALVHSEAALDTGFESERNLRNYTNIATELIRQTVDKDLAQAHQLAEKVVRRVRALETGDSQVKWRAMAKQIGDTFVHEAFEVAEDAPDKAVGFLVAGARLGVNRLYFWFILRSVVQNRWRSLRSDSTTKAHEFIAELRHCVGDEPELLRCIDDIGAADGGVRVIKMVDSENAIELLRDLIETDQCDRTNMAELSLLTGILVRCKELGMNREALRVIGQRCQELDPSSPLYRVCLSAYQRSIMDCILNENAAEALELLRDTQQVFGRTN